MLTKTQHQAPDQRPSDSCDPDPHASPQYPTPYWSDTIAAFSNSLRLPTGTADHDSLINTTQPWDSKTAAHSWFSTNRIPAPDSELPRIYSSAAVQDSATRATARATKQQARRIQVDPDRTQKLAIATWLTASRWTYNLTAEILQSGIPAVWKHIASMGFSSLPGEAEDACRAMSNVKTFNMELKAEQAQGKRANAEFAELGYRSRQNPKQSCYIPDDAVTEHGVYHTILGPLRMAEAIPEGHQECRPVQERGLYRLVVPYPAQRDIETPSGDGVVALDPGVRTFLTYFSETDCGKLGHHAFGRIPRLCHRLDDLISRTTKAPNRRKRRQMRRAQARMRQRIINLVDELHWQLARWLTSNYRIILLPTFETHDMTQKAGRRIRSKTARMMLTFHHFEFKQRLKWKAWQRGALVLDVDEAYTSKTRSWNGTVNTKLGSAKMIRDDTGFGMDRDVNGARGIFLRALGDRPFLRGLLTPVASQTTAAS